LQRAYPGIAVKSCCQHSAFILYNEGRMPQLTVRNVPEELARALRIRAARNGRSAEAEHRLILAQSLRNGESDFWTRADALRAAARPQRTDSAKLLREMRDSR
jgi:plasmid stability protein